MSLPARNRVIYQSEALFVSPDTTGQHIFYEPKLQTSNIDAAVISGKDKNNNDLFFHAYSGLVSDSSNFASSTDVRNYSFNCTGNNNIDPTNQLEMSGLHPILTAVGFSGSSNITSQPEVINHLTGTMAQNLGEGSWGSAIQQLKRVQNANYSFTINR